MVHQLSVTLEDLYNGVTKKLALQKNVICEKCEGKDSFLNESHSSGSSDLKTILIVLQFREKQLIFSNMKVRNYKQMASGPNPFYLALYTFYLDCTFI